MDNKSEQKRKIILRKLLIVQAFIEFVRPQDIIPVIGVIKPSLFVIVPIIYFSLPIYNSLIRSNFILKLSILFLILVVSSISWSVNTRFAFYGGLDLALVLFGFVFPFVYSFDSTGKLTKFIYYYVVFLALTSLFVVANGGKGPGGPIGDENDVALALAMAMPFAGFYMMKEKNNTKKYFFFLCVLLMILGVVSSSSRGGLLSMGVAITGIGLFAESRLKIIFVFFMVVLIVMPFIPESYYRDMGTISDTKDETRKDRVLGWEKSVRMFTDNKWFGVGAGNWGWVISKYETYEDLLKYRSHGGRAAHSIYFTVFPELGLIGGGVYILILFKLLLTYFHKYKERSAKIIRNSAIVSIGVFMVGGVFLSVLYYPFMWYLMAIIVAVDRTQLRYVKNA